MYILYENFNTTNQTQPKFAAHENFVADIKAPGCSLVDTLPYSQRCAFVKNKEFCDPEIQLINYLEFYYCDIEPDGTATEIVGVSILCVILCYLFLILGTIADKFFCPALTMLSKTLGMSEALAGVTLLAFGNGAPDIFSAMASLTPTTEIGLQYGELVGAASFVTAVVGGSIIIVKPFQVFALTCARDYLFLIFTILYIDTILHTDQMVTVMEGYGLLIIYVIYIIVVCVDQFILTQTSKDIQKNRKSLVKGNSALVGDSRMSMISYERLSTIHFLSVKSEEIRPPEIGVFKQFIKTINPLDPVAWREAGCCGKICKIIQIPLIVLTLGIPIADYDQDYNGWSRLLNSVQLIYMVPLFIKLVIDENFPILNLKVFLILIGVMAPVGIIVFLITKTNKIPRFHFVYSIIATFLSIGFISFVANEIIVILMVLGTVLNASSSFLGCTLLAWGNSVGDLVTNITLAKQGYQKMGFAACIGGPLFNILISCGITFLYKAYKNPGVNKLSPGALSSTNTVFLLIILSFTLLSFLLTEFQARRSIGFLLLTLYGLCFFYTIGATIEYFHPYGTDHSEESGF